MRYVAGVVPRTAGEGRGRPHGARTAYDHAAVRVWTVKYGSEESRTSSAGDVALLVVGECLSSEGELSGAARAARGGEWAAATRLPGSYLTVLRAGRTVRVIGDRSGVRTVYWAEGDEGTWWSTSATALAARVGAAPDGARLLAPLTVFGVDHLGANSYFAGVRRVSPGHALVLEEGQAPRVEQIPARYGTLTLEEGAVLLRDELRTAVHRRAAGVTLSADLSGGVDSSTLTALATEAADVHAVTYTDPMLAEQDDLRFARRLAADIPRLTHTVVNGGDSGTWHFDGLEEPDRLPVTDLPTLSVAMLGIKGAQLLPAVAGGAQLHLTGRGGDNVLDAPALATVDLARTGRVRDPARRLAALARERTVSTWAVLAQARRTARTSWPQALTALADRLPTEAPLVPFAQEKVTRSMLAWCGALDSARWLTAAGREAVAEVVAQAASTADPDVGPGAARDLTTLHRMGEEHATYDAITRSLWNLPVTAPYLDGPVVEACHAIPGWERRRPADFKPLARAAFTGTVPDYLLQRRTKTAFTASMHLGLRANARTLRGFLDNSRLADAGLVDPARVGAALDAAIRGGREQLGPLHMIVATELWLSTLRTRRESWWEPDPVPEGAR